MSESKACVIFSVKIFVVCIALSLIIFFSCLCFYQIIEKDSDRAVVNLREEFFVVIDAGHGGRDGGASSESGLLEKDLNLSASITLEDILKLCGIRTVMTRKDDSLVCDENDPSLKGKIKMTDLKNRLNIAGEYPESIFVSIHMNKFSIEKYSGLQVYYSPNNDKSLEMATTIQSRVTEVLQKDNTRKVKKAGSNIYLLDRISSPAVLIEYGFLSNRSEAERLSDPTYRLQLSLVIADCLLTNLTVPGNN